MDYDFVSFLESKLLERINRNENYSLRAFARDLDIPSGSLSSILSGKRNFPPKLFEKVISCFELENQDIEGFRKWVEASSRKEATFSNVDEGDAVAFARPHFSAVIELLNIDKFQTNVEELADAAKIGIEECKSVLQSLEEQGIIAYQQDRYVTKKKNIFLDPVPKSYMKEIVSASLEAIDQVSRDQRFHLCGAMAIAEDDLPEFKERFMRFYSQLTHWNSQRSSKDKVYYLNIGFNPPS